jgi:hypothetical protein
MELPKVTPLFAYNVVSTYTNYDLTLFIKELYKIKLKDPKGEIKSNSGGYQTPSILQLNPIFLPIIKDIKKIIKEGLNQECSITEMWGNISPKNCYNHIHHHSTLTSTNSLSGVIYIKTNLNSGNLDFYNPYNINDFISITPKNNLILIFPPDLPHSVNQNLNEEDRISISFNIELK